MVWVLGVWVYKGVVIEIGWKKFIFVGDGGCLVLVFYVDLFVLYWYGDMFDLFDGVKFLVFMDFYFN